MASFNENALRSVKIQWSIRNFHGCWHKTGERLESPLFHADFSSRTSWRLWLYPRGEDDGEYVSLYLFREEGGPEVVHVDFNLYLFPSIIYKFRRENFTGYSFNIHQREGIKCFASRGEFSPPKSYSNASHLLTIVCQIIDLEGSGLVDSVQTLCTRIGMECVYGTEICDNVTDIDVKSMLDDQPLISINLSCFEDSLVIKILPVICKKIKYSICKVTVIKNWGKESPIEHVRSWIGEIKADIRRYFIVHPETESFKPEMKALNNTELFVHYHFAFSTGEMELGGVERSDKYFMKTNVPFQQYLNAKSAKSALTALDALKENYKSESFADVLVKTKKKNYFAHKAILCARSSFFRSIIRENTSELTFECYGFDCQDLFWFLYTDTFVIPSSTILYELYMLSFSIDLEALKTHIRNILLRTIQKTGACDMLLLSVGHQDLLFETAVENYILAHYDSVLRKTDWEIFANYTELSKKVCLLKYKKQNTHSAL